MGRDGRVPTITAVAGALDDGASVREIAARWGCTARSVRNVAHRAGLVLPQARRRAVRQAPLGDPMWLTHQIDAGRSATSMADELGCSATEVRAAVAAAGRRLRVHRTPVRHHQLHEPGWLAAQLKAGRPLKAIATEVGCAVATVQKAVHRKGIVERRRRSERRFPELHDEAWLRRRYVDEARTSTEIAAMVGCSPHSVLRALDKHQVPKRGAVDRRVDELHDEGWLRRRYVDERQGPKAIAEELGCHRGTVIKALHRSRIARHRPRYPQLRDRAWLRRRYVDEGATMAAIAAEVGCSPGRVRDVMRQVGITSPRRRRARPPARRLRADWRLCATVSGVARLNEVGPGVAEVWLAEVGIFSPRARQLPAGELQALVAEGTTLQAIARHFGVDVPRVRVELLRHGVDTPAVTAKG